MVEAVRKWSENNRFLYELHLRRAPRLLQDDHKMSSRGSEMTSRLLKGCPMMAVALGLSSFL